MNRIKWWFVTMAFFLSLGAVLIAALRFGAAVGRASDLPMAVMVGSGLLALIFHKLRKHYGLLFCRVCGCDLLIGRGLAKNGLPEFPAVAIIHGQERFVGAVCPDCADNTKGGEQ